MNLENTADEEHPVNPRFRSLLENDHIQNFLQRHGLTTCGGIPLRRKEVEERLQQIDNQSEVDLIAQSLVEKALDIKRPLGKHAALPDHNPCVALYDNSCAITMIFCGLQTYPDDTLYAFKIQSDEVIIMQYQSNASSIIVYKSFLKPNDEFTFKSHRLLDTPFTIAIYINGVIDSRTSTCCEQGYLKQRHLRSRGSAFRLQSVTGGTLCYTCQANHLMDSSISDEEIQSELISNINSTQTIPSISPRSEPSVTISSTRKIKKQPKTTTSKANIQTSTEVEKMVGNEETEKGLKSEDKTVNQRIMQTDDSTPKLNQNELIQMKIASEEEAEGQGMISSIGNHEMLQLLSKYLSLLLPSPKSPANGTQKQIEFKTATSSDPFQRENVEAFLLIWLDAAIDTSEETIVAQTKLRAIINSLVTFRTTDEAIHFIQNVNKEKVFLIVCGSLRWTFIERIEMQDFSQLDSIYVYCRAESQHHVLIERERKVRGVFTSIDSLCKRLQEDINQTFNDLLPISVTPGAFTKTKSMADKEKQVEFLCRQLNRELLLIMEYPDDARLNLVKFCMNMYADNPTLRESIEELRNEYHNSNAIWWYKRPSFLQKMLTTALIRQDIPMLYKFHFFIKDLHIQLARLHSSHKSSLESRTFIVYRGLGIPMKVFDETIRQEVNHLLAFDTFLSTTLNREVALNFARNKSNNDDQSILFQIEIDTEKLARPFADISHLCEDEILFSIGTVFRIDHVAEEKTSDGIWLVHLSSVDENDRQLGNEIKQMRLTLFNFFKRVWQAQIKRGDRRQIATSYLNMASIYYKQNQYQESLELYQKALENLLELPEPDPLTIAIYRSHIAQVYMALDQHSEALRLYEQVLHIRMKYCAANDPFLIDTLHAIGNIYRRRKEFNKALKQYQKALDMQLISLESPLTHNLSSIAATHINIALVHQQQNSIDQALEHFLQALYYQQQYLSKYHPILVFLYNHIGAIYYHLENFELALENQLITLQIEERSLPKEHKTLAVTYSTIAITYEQLKDYDQAIDYARKSIHQLKFHLPEDHFDVQTKQVYLDRLSMDKRSLLE